MVPLFTRERCYHLYLLMSMQYRFTLYLLINEAILTCGKFWFTRYMFVFHTIFVCEPLTSENGEIVPSLFLFYYYYFFFCLPVFPGVHNRRKSIIGKLINQSKPIDVS